MRYYEVTHCLKDGRPYIEAEATSKEAIEDQAKPLTRGQLEADPALREALEAWERKDDSLQAIDHASWVLEHYGLGIVLGAADAEEAVELAEGVADPWCEALREALPHLNKAAFVIEPMMKAVLKNLEARGLKARAEDAAIESV
ncbi:MAG: hypothetical protein H0W97_09240 [Actinobacteria bacterium]|nr:hypothetical protein [Actinomycetota bacterium]